MFDWLTELSSQILVFSMNAFFIYKLKNVNCLLVIEVNIAEVVILFTQISHAEQT